MKVILDSNIIISDWHLKKPSWVVLLQSSLDGEMELLIPQLVIDEVSNKFAERLKEAQTKTNKELSVVKKLTDKDIRLSIEDKEIKELAGQYVVYLLTVFQTNKVKIVPYPNISHGIIALKAIKKIKPFNDNEKGYRDAIIWESVKEQVPKNGTVGGRPAVVFITSNKIDFFDEKLMLHKDLIEEMEDSDLDIEALKTYPDLQSFSDEVIKLLLDQADSFKQRLVDSDFEDFRLSEAISIILDKELLRKELDDELPLPHYYQNPTVEFIENVGIDRIDDVRKVNSSDFLVKMTVKADLQLDFYIDKYEHFSRDDESYSVEDADWNEYVIWASEIIESSFNVTIIISNDLTLKASEINFINPKSEDRKRRRGDL